MGWAQGRGWAAALGPDLARRGACSGRPRSGRSRRRSALCSRTYPACQPRMNIRSQAHSSLMTCRLQTEPCGTAAITAAAAHPDGAAGSGVLAWRGFAAGNPHIRHRQRPCCRILSRRLRLCRLHSKRRWRRVSRAGTCKCRCAGQAQIFRVSDRRHVFCALCSSPVSTVWARAPAAASATTRHASR